MGNRTPSATELRQEQEKALVVEKLKEIPIVQVACAKSKIGRATYYRWLRDDPAFAQACGEAVREGTDFINDMSESQIVTLIKKEKLAAISLWLKHHHPTYGAKEKISGRLPEAELTPEQKKIVERALRIGRPQTLTYAKQKRHSGRTV